MNSLKDFKLDIMGIKMIIDLDELIKQVILDKKEIDGKLIDDFAINAPKYEIFRLLLEVILSSQEEMDNKMGYKSLDNSGFPFKLAFNTLIEHKILKEIN
jgi:hypothetical protein